MNTAQLKEEYEAFAAEFKNNAQLQEAWADLKPFIGNVVVSVVFMVKARRARKAGNMERAIYYAILWAGYTNNTNGAFRERMAVKRHKQILARQGSTPRQPYAHLVN